MINNNHNHNNNDDNSDMDNDSNKTKSRNEVKRLGQVSLQTELNILYCLFFLNR